MIRPPRFCPLFDLGAGDGLRWAEYESGPIRLAFSSVPVNADRLLTVIGAILDRVRRTELSLPSRFVEEGIRAELVARDRGVAAVRGDIARLRGPLLARERVRALGI